MSTLRRRRRSAPLLPKDFVRLREVLLARPSLRVELINTALAARRPGQVHYFVWRGRQFRFVGTAKAFNITDGCGHRFAAGWE
jgi:hypothetical protein